MSGTAAGCLSWEVWWLRTRSTVLAIRQSARSYCRLLWERWLHPLHLLGPVLLGCCRLHLTFLSKVIVLQPPLLCEGWGGHLLCLSGDTPVLMDFHWPLWLYSSVQYSVHRFSIFHSSVKHFPERSWTVVAFPCFTVVKSFRSWYALLLLFFLRFSSISHHCSPIRFSFAFFMHLLMLLFTSLYFSDPSGSNRFFLSSLLLLHRSRISALTQVVFVSSSNDVYQGSHWRFEWLLCWRWWSLNPGLCLHCPW